MEKLIFFVLVIPILAFVLYLGGSAIMKGFKAKEKNKSEDNHDEDLNDLKSSENLSDELMKLNELLQSGALTHEYFVKAKKKLLDN